MVIPSRIRETKRKISLHPASRIPYPVSRIPHPVSRIPYLASRIPHPASRIPKSGDFSYLLTLQLD
jgi:hypothetical protein